MTSAKFSHYWTTHPCLQIHAASLLSLSMGLCRYICLDMYRVFEWNRDQVAWLGRWAGWGQLLLSGSFVLKWLKDRVQPKGPMVAWPDSFQWKLWHYGRGAQAFWLWFRSHSTQRPGSILLTYFILSFCMARGEWPPSYFCSFGLVGSLLQKILVSCLAKYGVATSTLEVNL